MSGLSSVGASSGSLLSQVGQSLLANGAAPDATPASTAPAKSTTLSSYQTEYLTLQQQDTSELLYASFLSPAAGLANADAVLGQAAQLLGTPGSPAPASATGTSSPVAASASPATVAPPALPSVSSILAASDSAAQQTLAAYGNAPADSSIIDYQA